MASGIQGLIPSFSKDSANYICINKYLLKCLILFSLENFQILSGPHTIFSPFNIQALLKTHGLISKLLILEPQ